MSQEVTIKQLLEAGVHFGHYTNRWNPKMDRFIYTDRNKVYIIDLEQTLSYLTAAAEFLKGVAGAGGTVLFVGTKRQAQQAILEAAQKSAMPYVNQRWLGGMLTNFETVRRSVARLDELEKMEAEGTYQFLTKKEVAGLNTQREKLLKVLIGVRHMKRLPQAIFVVDPKQEEISVREARRLGIPVVAIIDTNCDPDVIDHPIPGNDDAIRSVKLICDVIGSAVEEGRSEYARFCGEEERKAEEAKASEAEGDIEAADEDAEDKEPESTLRDVEEVAESLTSKAVDTKAKEKTVKRKPKRSGAKKEVKKSV